MSFVGGRTSAAERRRSAFQARERQQCAEPGVEQPVSGFRPECLLMAGKRPPMSC